MISIRRVVRRISRPREEAVREPQTEMGWVHLSCRRRQKTDSRGSLEQVCSSISPHACSKSSRPTSRMSFAQRCERRDSTAGPSASAISFPTYIVTYRPGLAYRGNSQPVSGSLSAKTPCYSRSVSATLIRIVLREREPFAVLLLGRV